MKPDPIIDADGHVLENTIDWEAGLPDSLKPLAPKNLTVDTGGGRMLIEGKIWPQPWGMGRGAVAPPVAPMSYREGAIDPSRHIADLDAEGGIDVAFNYGAVVGVGVSGLDTAELAAALARIYNDWLAAYCAYAPDRLKAVAAIPLQDVSLAVAEARRAIEELGMTGVSIPSNVHGRPLHDITFEPFFAEVERLGVPLGIHVGPGIHGVPVAGADRFDNFLMIHPISHPFEQMLAMVSLIIGGVLERQPKLKVAFLESGAGWVPFITERMDEDYEKLPTLAPSLKGKPSDYVRSGRCFFACGPDESTLPMVLEFAGEDHVIYASDYPHWDCKFPESARAIYQREDISPQQKAKVLGDNARRLYGL